MAKNTASTVITWGAVILIALFVFPRVLAAMTSANARSRALTSPGAAASTQAARAVNTAGLTGNTALARLMQQLLGQKQQQSSSGKSGGSGSGSGSSPSSAYKPSAIAPVPRRIPSQPSTAGISSISQSDMNTLYGAQNFQVAPPAPDAYGVAADTSSVYDNFNWGVAPPPVDSDAVGYSDTSSLYDNYAWDVAPPASDAWDVGASDWGSVYDSYGWDVAAPMEPGYSDYGSVYDGSIYGGNDYSWADPGNSGGSGGGIDFYDYGDYGDYGNNAFDELSEW